MRSDEFDWSEFISEILYLLFFSLGLWILGEVVIWFFTNIKIGWGKT